MEGLPTARLAEHLGESRKNARGDWSAVCLQGSQSYGLSDEGGDIDGKLPVPPCFEDVVPNRRAASRARVTGNGGRCDAKDIRERFKAFRKQNASFVEVLFTERHLFDNGCADLWTELLRRREEIARCRPGRAVKRMKGMACEKPNALAHEHPSRMPWTERCGYDPKRPSRILRLDIMIGRYVAGAPYGERLDMSGRPELLRAKRDGDGMTAAEAAETAQEACRRISSKADAFCEERGLRTDESADALLDGMLFEAVSRAFGKELGA